MEILHTIQLNNQQLSGFPGKDLSESEYIPLEKLNWPEFPYRPVVHFYIAYSKTGLLLYYKVQEEDPRAECGQINGRVWEDSCVECFLSFGDDTTYYNFEFNSIGIPHVAYGYSRNDREMIPESILKKISTIPSLGKKPYGVKKGKVNWDIRILIPPEVFIHHRFDNLPGSAARANLYKCGDLCVRPHFLSWKPIHTDKPDFHRPEFFGEIRFYAGPASPG